MSTLLSDFLTPPLPPSNPTPSLVLSVCMICGWEVTTLLSCCPIVQAMPRVCAWIGRLPTANTGSYQLQTLGVC